MIYYFSGTGNSKWVAEQLAERLSIQAVSIIALSDVAANDSEPTGLVFPVYAWAMPEVVANFAAKLPRTKAFTFAVCTCGDDVGYTMKNLGKLVRLDSTYSVKMPNNYIIGMDIDSADETVQKIAAAKKKTAKICDDIKAKKPVTDVHIGSIPFLKTFAAFGFNKFARTTKPFYATDQCNACGLCVSICPTGTISLQNGKPVWGKKCYQCLGCINRCPKAAIQYGKGTIKRGRYYFEKDE